MLKGVAQAHSHLASGDVYTSSWPQEPILVLFLRLTLDSHRSRLP